MAGRLLLKPCTPRSLNRSTAAAAPPFKRSVGEESEEANSIALDSLTLCP